MFAVLLKPKSPDKLLYALTLQTNSFTPFLIRRVFPTFNDKPASTYNDPLLPAGLGVNVTAEVLCVRSLVKIVYATLS